MSDGVNEQLARMAKLQKRLAAELVGCQKLAADVTAWMENGRRLQQALGEWSDATLSAVNDWCELRQQLDGDADDADWWKSGEDDRAE